MSDYEELFKKEKIYKEKEIADRYSKAIKKIEKAIEAIGYSPLSGDENAINAKKAFARSYILVRKQDT